MTPAQAAQTLGVSELARELAPLVADLLREHLADVLWSRKQVESYSGFGRSTVAAYMALPGFPKAVRVGKGDPRYKASEVRKWFERQKERN